MSTSRALVVAHPPPRTRSKVTNGATLFVEADGRSAWARRFADLVAAYTEHVGGSPTLPQRSLIRRIATIDIECEQMEGERADGRAIDGEVYGRLASGQRRLLEELGFKAAKRDRAPTVDELKARHAR